MVERAESRFVTSTGLGDQVQTDRENAIFWNSLCGSRYADMLHIRDASRAELERYDDWYFGFYPYLERHIRFSSLSERVVLEVGLGYGSVAQRLAERGAVYHGIDISPGPVAMVQHRLQRCGLRGDVKQASVLSCPYPDEFFDCVIAIGCYHHTGNLRLALDETFRILKTGGYAVVMIYNAYSYRRWMKWPLSTLRHALGDKLGIGQRTGHSTIHERAGYDEDGVGSAAPETVFSSLGDIRRMTTRWGSRTIVRENIGSERFLRHVERNTLNRVLGPLMGLDLYCRLQK